MSKTQSPDMTMIDKALADKAVRSLSARVDTALPMGKIGALLSTIEHDVTAKGGAPLIHFTSAYAGQGSNRIAFELAYYAATHDHKRVLFLDNDENTGQIASSFRQGRVTTIDQFLKSEEGVLPSPFMMVDGTSFYYAAFSQTNARQNLPLNARLRTALFDHLRTKFDLIIVPSESALSAGSASAFAAIADGTIIVVEAERTRVPVVKEVKQRIESSGGRVMGTVLNRRHRYIPGFVYKLLFKNR